MSGTESEAQQEREAERSLAKVQQGGLPVVAERRLAELREGGRGAFTSDLSVNGFALCHRLGVKPLSQVMGSAVYQVGYQGVGWQSLAYGSATVELETLSEAWNEVRRLALNRLEMEARQLGADAVVGVQITTTAREGEGSEAIEYMVVGTAVRREGAPANGQPVMTELSVADYAKLLDAGIEPVGIVARTSVFFVAASPEMEAMGGLGGRMAFPENQELTTYTEGIYSAREQTMARLGQQARQLGASGIVGVRIGHTIRHRQFQNMGASRGGLLITFDAIGTAIREETPRRPQPPKPSIDLSI